MADQVENQDAGAGNEPALTFAELVGMARAGAAFTGNQDEVDFWGTVNDLDDLLAADVAGHLAFLRETGTYGGKVADGVEGAITEAQGAVDEEVAAQAKSAEDAILAEAAQKLKEEREQQARDEALRVAREKLLADETASQPTSPADERMAEADQLVDQANEAIEQHGPGSQAAYDASRKAVQAVREAQQGSPDQPVGVNVEEFLSRINRELEEQ